MELYLETDTAECLFRMRTVLSGSTELRYSLGGSLVRASCIGKAGTVRGRNLGEMFIGHLGVERVDHAHIGHDQIPHDEASSERVQSV